MKFTLDLLPGTYPICRPAPDSPLPDWGTGSFVSVTTYAQLWNQ